MVRNSISVYAKIKDFAPLSSYSWYSKNGNKTMEGILRMKIIIVTGIYIIIRL